MTARHDGTKTHEELRARAITGRELLFSELDEKFPVSFLTATGTRLTDDYYATQAYFTDYATVLGGSRRRSIMSRTRGRTTTVSPPRSTSGSRSGALERSRRRQRREPQPTASRLVTST